MPTKLSQFQTQEEVWTHIVSSESRRWYKLSKVSGLPTRWTFGERKERLCWYSFKLTPGRFGLRSHVGGKLQRRKVLLAFVECSAVMSPNWIGREGGHSGEEKEGKREETKEDKWRKNKERVKRSNERGRKDKENEEEGVVPCSHAFKAVTILFSSSYSCLMYHDALLLSAGECGLWRVSINWVLKGRRQTGWSLAAHLSPQPLRSHPKQSPEHFLTQISCNRTTSTLVQEPLFTDFVLLYCPPCYYTSLENYATRAQRSI